jgi:hypothetical protein
MLGYAAVVDGVWIALALAPIATGTAFFAVTFLLVALAVAPLFARFCLALIVRGGGAALAGANPAARRRLIRSLTRMICALWVLGAAIAVPLAWHGTIAGPGTT